MIGGWAVRRIQSERELPGREGGCVWPLQDYGCQYMPPIVCYCKGVVSWRTVTLTLSVNSTVCHLGSGMLLEMQESPKHPVCGGHGWGKPVMETGMGEQRMAGAEGARQGRWLVLWEAHLRLRLVSLLKGTFIPDEWGAPSDHRYLGAWVKLRCAQE